jgi:hypothetical protein
MTGIETAGTSIYLDKRMVTAGGALVVAGGLLGFAGMAIAGTALLVAARRWVQQMEVSPRELAALRWQQAKQATMAGAQAWREAAPAVRS